MIIETRNCRAAWAHMTAISDRQPVRNFVQVLDMSDYLVETDLFPEAALIAYSDLNMEKDISDEQRQYISELRGGAQGNYSEGMARKIANVIHPYPTRAEVVKKAGDAFNRSRLTPRVKKPFEFVMDGLVGGGARSLHEGLSRPPSRRSRSSGRAARPAP